MSEYLRVAAVVFGVKPAAAFGPPTWALLVLFRLNSDVAAVPLVLIGAISAASGRLLLPALPLTALGAAPRQPRSRSPCLRRPGAQPAGFRSEVG